MANIILALVSLFVLQATSMVASNDDALIVPTYIEEASKLDNVVTSKDVQHSTENENSQRQKRFYDYKQFPYSQLDYPTNFPPPLPFYSHFSKRDESQNTGIYGGGDVLSRIYTSLEQILSNTRRYTYPVPQQTPFPTFIPLLVISQFGCGCDTKNDNPSTTPQINNNNNQPQPNIPTESTTTIASTTPDLSNRFNSINDTESNEKVEDDGKRPVSFDPIIPETPIDIPVPPVEHGSFQAGAKSESIPTTTFRAILNSPANAPPAASKPSIVARLPSIAPSACDAAVIRCCVGPRATPNCFVQNDCPDTSKYGNPCDPEVIHNVINKVRFYYQQTRL